MVKPIRTEEDYEAALDRFDALFSSTNEEDVDELDVLSTLLAAYEREEHGFLSLEDLQEDIQRLHSEQRTVLQYTQNVFDLNARFQAYILWGLGFALVALVSKGCF